MSIEFHFYILIVLFLLALLFVIFRFGGINPFSNLEINEVDLGVGSSTIKINPNRTDAQIAYKIWVELSTRKIGLEIDLDQDVITEIYDSWYEFFSVTRELVKEVPAGRLKRKDTRDIIGLSIKVLNFGVRPHLTQWQAKFRRWYKKELDDENDHSLPPQEVQKRFPEYTELAQDLMRINKNLINYRKNMYQLVVGVA